MLKAKLTDLATRGLAEGYDAETIAVLEASYHSRIRAERCMMRSRRLQSTLSLELVPETEEGAFPRKRSN
jgi:hypothetical protein